MVQTEPWPGPHLLCRSVCGICLPHILALHWVLSEWSIGDSSLSL
jgi:hypothetical protein